MNDEPAGAHAAFEELAAAYALHALDRNDEQLFVDHLDECAQCAANLDEYRLVAAQLGAVSDGESDEVPAWDRIRSMVVPASHAAVAQLEVARRRRRRAARVLAAAAAVVALSGGAVAGWDATHGTSRDLPGTAAALAACQRQAGCRVVRMHNPDGTDTAAVLVNTDRVALVPLAMASAPAGRTYALWQLPRDGRPILITEFRDTSRQTSSVPLPSDYPDTAAFAVSVEPADTTPLRPTHVLAVGTAS